MLYFIEAFHTFADVLRNFITWTPSMICLKYMSLTGTFVYQILKIVNIGRALRFTDSALFNHQTNKFINLSILHLFLPIKISLTLILHK